MQGVPCRDSGEVYGIFERDRRSNGEGLHKKYKANIGIGVTEQWGMQTQPTRLAYKLAVAKEIYDALMERL